ncbi:MAG: ATP-binding cassette domain-containing protein [Gemmatimonadales bacterium]
MNGNPARATGGTNGPILTMRGVCKYFGRGLARSASRTAALRDIDLELRPGEVLGVIGDEGAGKTALMQCAAGLLRRDAGEIRWLGRSFPGGGLLPGVAYVPAIPVFYPFLTVRDVLSFRLAKDSTPRQLREGLMDDALALTDLGDRAGELVAMLSPEAMKQLAIAEAIVCEPEAVLVDTSTADVKPPLQPKRWHALECLATRGVAVMIASRDYAGIGSVTTRLLRLSEGTVIAYGTEHHRSSRIHFSASAPSRVDPV